MRITGGTMRGRALPGRLPDGVRPTAARVREALFSMLGQDLAGATVLDAFGGSGLLGFEARSRGAAVTIVEKRPQVARWIRAAAEAIGADVEVRVADAAAALAGGEAWDVVLLDPPYAQDPAAWVERGAGAAREALVIEHAAGRAVPAEAGALRIDRVRRYGDTTLVIYRVSAE